MTSPSASVSRLAEANMKRWLNRQQLEQKIAEEVKGPKLGPYLVISRQCGANGQKIADLLGKELGWDVVDRQILDSIARDFNVSERLVEFVDEKHVAWLTGIFEAWFEKSSFSQEGYVHELGKLLMIAAQHGKFVMVGRGAQFILPRQYGFFVQLYAPVERRIDNIAASQKLAEKDARDFVTKTDQERGQFLKSYFRNDGSDPNLYDLAINTSQFDCEPVANLILQAMKLRNIPIGATT